MSLEEERKKYLKEKHLNEERIEKEKISKEFKEMILPVIKKNIDNIKNAYVTGENFIVINSEKEFPWICRTFEERDLMCLLLNDYLEMEVGSKLIRRFRTKVSIERKKFLFFKNEKFINDNLVLYFKN